MRTFSRYLLLVACGGLAVCLWLGLYATHASPLAGAVGLDLQCDQPGPKATSLTPEPSALGAPATTPRSPSQNRAHTRALDWTPPRSPQALETRHKMRCTARDRTLEPSVEAYAPHFWGPDQVASAHTAAQRAYARASDAYCASLRADEFVAIELTLEPALDDSLRAHARALRFSRGVAWEESVNVERALRGLEAETEPTWRGGHYAMLISAETCAQGR